MNIKHKIDFALTINMVEKIPFNRLRSNIFLKSDIKFIDYLKGFIWYYLKESMTDDDS